MSAIPGTRPPDFELSRPIAVDRIAAHGMDVTVTAELAERVEIALRLRIPAVHALVCRFRLDPGPAGQVSATGVLTARVTQTCVVSLDDFAADVAESFEVLFVPQDQLTDTGEDPESIDQLPYDGDRIDLGEAAVEQLALALDPYPRKPGAALPDATDEGVPHPFAALAALKRPS